MDELTQRGSAILFALLLITAGLPPTVVAADDPRELSNDATNNVRSPTTSLGDAANATPRERKRAAVAAAAALNTGGESRLERERKRVRDGFAGTLSSYRDGYRVTTEATFRADAKAVERLSKFSTTDPDRADTGSLLAYSADRATVNRSIADARRAFERFEDDVETPGQRRKVEEAIRNAEKAYARAQRTIENAEGENVERTIEARAEALHHLATAWRHSQRALDALDANVAPEVTIVTRRDPARNGTSQTTRVVAGNVTAVRPTQIDGVTVTVNGNDSFEAPVHNVTAPATNETFVFNATFTEQITTIEVVATDPPERGTGTSGSADGKSEAKNGADEQSKEKDGEKKKGGGKKKDDGQKQNADDEQSGAGAAGPGKHVQTGTDALKLDGDGLADRYETRVVGMDPLDPNSDSARTDADEADDERIDGAEDFDGQLITFREAVRGTDPFEVDTDGDGLTDKFEIFEGLSPTDADADDDGVGDGEEDRDDDGVTNLREQDLQTDPFEGDTDGDGLADTENEEYDTNATDEDTDGDGVLDGDELDVGTDPLVADTDGDGVLDGDETFTTNAENESLGATVSVTGDGNVAAGVSIEEPADRTLSKEYAPDAAVSNFVSFESDEEFESANITLRYDESAVQTNESSVAVFRYDRENRTMVELNSTVDATNDTVTAETPHFSTYVAFDARAWDDYLSSITAGGGESGSGDLADLPEADGKFVDVLSVDPSGYSTVTAYATVDTPEGRNGELTAADFSVYEEGAERSVESVEFTEGTAVDVVFVFDDTGSMYGEINSMKRNAREFASGVEDSGIDARYALVSFKDGNHVDQSFTSDFDEFENSVDRLYARGGWDYPEDSLDAIHTGSTLDFREDAQKVVVHITDADSHASWRTSHGVDEIETVMRQKGISFYTVAPPDNEEVVDLADRVGGIWINIRDFDTGAYSISSNNSTRDWSDSRQTYNATTKKYTQDGTKKQTNATDGDDAAAVRSADDKNETSAVGTASYSGSTDSFGVFLDDLRSSLTSRYKVTFTTCLPADGNGRRVDLYADTSDGLGRGVDGYLAPETGASGSCGDGVDSDGDGISDSVEEEGTPVAPFAERIPTDPDDPDTDGDGLKDGEEILVDQSVGKGDYFFGYVMRSDPRKENSDGVGLNDSEEVTKAEPSNPMNPEILVAGLNVPTLHRDGKPVSMAEAPRDSTDNPPCVNYCPDADEYRVTIYRDYWKPCSGILCWFDDKPGWVPDDTDDDHVYFRVDGVVNVQESGIDEDELHYEIENSGGVGVEVVDTGDLSGRVTEGSTRVDIVMEADNGNFRADYPSYQMLGRMQLRIHGVDSTDVQHPDGSGTLATNTVKYAIWTDTFFPEVKDLLKTTREVYDKGMMVASLTRGGLMKYEKTGSVRTALRHVLWEYAKGKVIPVQDGKDLAQLATVRGIAAFEDKADEVQARTRNRYFYGEVSYAQITVARAS